MRIFLLATLLAIAVAAGPARADVTESSPSSFLISAEAEVAAAPDAVWVALPQVSRWWSGAHTYSGDAANLSLDLQPGGCWCERWGEGQAIEHMRLVLMMEHGGVSTLRLVGGLGPLQEMGVSGVLTFTVAPGASGARITMTYRVAGDPSLQLDRLAPLVDMVLMEQFTRFSRFSASGSAD